MSQTSTTLQVWIRFFLETMSELLKIMVLWQAKFIHVAKYRSVRKIHYDIIWLW